MEMRLSAWITGSRLRLLTSSATVADLSALILMIAVTLMASLAPSKL